MSYQKKPPLIAHRKSRERSAGYAIDVFNAILTQQAEAAAKVAGAPAIKEENIAGHNAVNHPSKQEVGHDAVGRPSNPPAGHDAVNHPSHYCQGGIECIDAIQAAVTGLSGMEAVCAGNVIKYVWRAKYKNGVEDLKKARFYLNKLILLTERKNCNE